MARRIREINGSRIATLYNGSEHAEFLAREAARFYAERHDGVLTATRHRSRPALPADDSELHPLIDASDFLILTIGDGEAGAERLLADAIRCEQLGASALAVATKPFSELADATALRSGVLHYPFIAVGPPIAGAGAGKITERALHVYCQGMATLTGVYRMMVWRAPGASAGFAGRCENRAASRCSP